MTAGSAANVIPLAGVLRGTIRTLSRTVWESLPPIAEEVIREVASTYGVGVEVDYLRGVPPTVNDRESVAALAAAVAELGPDVRVVDTPQSLGGEDFAWYLERIPGALARLGVRTPGGVRSVDLHQSEFDVDERCINVGVSVLTAVALATS
jgi:amidohydrolase